MINSTANTGGKARISTLIIDAKSAPCGRFFVFTLHVFLLLSTAGQVAANNEAEICTSGVFDDFARIEHIIDGDTVVLQNGERLRLIGVNTPEIRHDGTANDAGAIEARNYLSTLIKPRSRLPLKYDNQRRDHFGRLLAHLFLPDGVNIQARLLSGGYATLLTIPPNLAFLECYQHSAQQAQRSRLGIWGYQQYQQIDAADLTGEERGYYTIKGRIKRVSENKSSLWINMGSLLALRIAREDLKYFQDQELVPAGLTGKDALVRGMVYRHNGQLHMRIRHPADIRILYDTKGTQ